MNALQGAEGAEGGERFGARGRLSPEGSGAEVNPPSEVSRAELNPMSKAGLLSVAWQDSAHWEELCASPHGVGRTMPRTGLRHR